MRTRSRGALIAAVTACVSGGLVAQERTEQELIDLIVRDGPRARAIRAAADVVIAEQAARSVFPNPVASYTREGAGFTEFALIEQSLPAFGLRDALARAGVAAREAAEAERDARLWQLRSDARDAIARLRIALRRTRSAESTIRLVEGLIAVLRTREQEGEGSRFDRVRAEQELVESQQQLVAAAVDRAEARSALSALLPAGTFVPDLDFGADTTALPPAVDALVTRASTSRAELRALQAAAQRFSSEADVARRATGLAPTISGGLKRADDGNDTRAGAVVGVSVVAPLFNRGSREADRWNAERTRVEFERVVLDADIRAEITRAAEALALRLEHSRAIDASLKSGEELITIADVAYREGDIGILQLLDAYRTAARARERAIDAHLSLRRAQTALERAVGATLWP
jgi:cobalt-zinc-cadmium efflux system outer membrane protein